MNEYYVFLMGLLCELAQDFYYIIFNTSPQAYTENNNNRKVL